MTRHAVVTIVQRFPLSDIFSGVCYLSTRHPIFIDHECQESCLNLHTLVHLAPPCTTPLLLVPVNRHHRMSLHTAVNRVEVATPPAMDMLKLVDMLSCRR